MAEGSPEMNNQMNGAVATTQGQLGESAAQELVFAYAQKLPPQLEHWVRKRSMRLHSSESMAVNPAEIKAQGARYVIIDLDTQPRDRSAVDIVRSLRQAIPELRIIVVSAHSDDMFVRSMQDAGANGIVIKQPYVADLVFALQAASEGRTFISGVTNERDRAAVQITAREREVLELMANGHSNQAIGERLSISVKTVEAHRARLFKKLGASNVADAVLLAIRTGLVMP
jgi:two-component system NarL family response regulator